MDTEPIIKKRNPFIAFLLSIWTPGLGQVYNGQLIKGAIILSITLLGYILLSAFNIGTTFYGLVLTICGIFIIRLYGIIDAIVQAFRLRNYTLKSINTNAVYFGWGIGSLGISVVFVISGVFGVQPYTIPTSSMSPTILPGEYIVANKRIDIDELKYGDIIVYNSHRDGYYTSRIVGLPGDTVKLEDDIVVINHKKSTAAFVRKNMMERFMVDEFMETFPNGATHNIYKFSDPLLARDEARNTAEYIVPKGSFFLVSDNRDNALDSRYLGPIKHEDVAGKLLYIACRYKKTKRNRELKFNIKL